MAERIAIAYYLEDPVANWLHAQARELANMFDIPNRYDLAPPHITLKYPVADVPNMHVDELEGYFEHNFRDLHAAPIIFTGVLHTFPDARVIFAEVQKTRAASLLGMAIMEGFHQWAFLYTNPYEVTVKSLYQKFDFAGEWHVTLASGMTPEKYEEVWDYIKKRSFPRHEVALDKITLIKIEEGRHVPIRTCELTNP